GELVDGKHVADPIHGRPPELLVPRHAEESELTHLLDVLPGEVTGPVELRGDGGDLVGCEIAHHLANHPVVLVEVLLHRPQGSRSPGWLRPAPCIKPTVPAARRKGKSVSHFGARCVRTRSRKTAPYFSILAGPTPLTSRR